MSTIKIKDFPSAIFYKTICDCTNNECTQTIIVEHDEDIDDMISITLYNKLYLRAYNESWWRNLQRRIVYAFQILFKGWFEVEGDIVLRGEDVKAYFTALEEGYNKMNLRGKTNGIG